MLEKIVSPSILSADFAQLQKDVESVSAAKWLHCDVMDGQFVPNLSFGAPIIKNIKTDHVKDVHLMIETPWKLLDDFVTAGSEYITFHIEACDEEFDAGRVIDIIHESGVKAGLSLRPGTPVSDIEPFTEKLDLVLIMSVEPGFGGQSFMDDQLDKISYLREKRPEMHVSIDGGINADTGKLARDAGANILVAGSYIFRAEDRRVAISSLE